MCVLGTSAVGEYFPCLREAVVRVAYACPPCGLYMEHELCAEHLARDYADGGIHCGECHRPIAISEPVSL